MSTKTNTVYVDLDGTLCPVKRPEERYEDLPAREDVIQRLQEIRSEGLRVVVHTARNMRTYNGDLSMITSVTAPSILRWLEQRKVPFDGLLVGKPWPGPRGFYVDDKAIRPDEFVSLSTQKIIQIIGAENE